MSKGNGQSRDAEVEVGTETGPLQLPEPKNIVVIAHLDPDDPNGLNIDWNGSLQPEIVIATMQALQETAKRELYRRFTKDNQEPDESDDSGA